MTTWSSGGRRQALTSFLRCHQGHIAALRGCEICMFLSSIQLQVHKHRRLGFGIVSPAGLFTRPRSSSTDSVEELDGTFSLHVPEAYRTSAKGRLFSLWEAHATEGATFCRPKPRRWYPPPLSEKLTLATLCPVSGGQQANGVVTSWSALVKDCRTPVVVLRGADGGAPG